MASTRLPNKVMADLAGRPMLAHVVSRVRRARFLSDVAVATTLSSQDDVIATFCSDECIPCFRGSEEDVLDRYYEAARAFAVDVVVRITADCPLHDPRVIDAVVSEFDPATADYVSNTIERTYPDGLDTEVLSFATLTRAWREARWTSEREHVTTYVCKHPELFRIKQVRQPRDLSALRWTVDEPRDLAFAREIVRRLPEGFGMEEVETLLAGNPTLRSINADIAFNEGHQISIRRDRMVDPGKTS
jgi:spore coat polysaccharide biosynthesis protein SpsF